MNVRLRLTARPRPDAAGHWQPGTTPVALTTGRPGLVHVPPGPVRGLVVALHGAGGRAVQALDLVRADADRAGLVVLAPVSAGSTWSMIRGGPDVDTAALDAALDGLFAAPLDPGAVGVAGFSDGASYALSLALANGDLFSWVAAFSPGFQAADRRQGRPRCYVSHGVHDQVLPIERTSRRIVPALRADGYDVSYREFDGGHTVPAACVAEAVDRMLLA